MRVVRRRLSSLAPRYALPVSGGEQWTQLRFGYRVATVNSDKIPTAMSAGGGYVVIADGDLTAGRGEISARAHRSFAPSPGPLALWRGVLRDRDGDAVRDLDWLDDDGLGEPCLRLEWFLDPVVELQRGHDLHLPLLVRRAAARLRDGAERVT